MTREEREEAIRCLSVHSSTNGSGLCTDEQHYEAKQIAIQALSQEPCEKQIKIGTKVRTTKDKDFACEKVFPIGTIGIVERIDKGDNLPYKIVANNDYFYYSRDMFEIIEDVEPCDDAISRKAVCNIVNDIRDCISVEGYCAILERLKKLPPVTQKSGKWIKSIDYIGNVKCSICQKEYDQDVLYDAKYCPNCGARMESEDKE